MRRREFITLIWQCGGSFLHLRRNGADIVAAKFSRGTRKEMKVPKNPTAS
jgi:hypothetical protein